MQQKQQAATTKASTVQLLLLPTTAHYGYGIYLRIPQLLREVKDNISNEKADPLNRTTRIGLLVNFLMVRVVAFLGGILDGSSLHQRVGSNFGSPLCCRRRTRRI